MDRAQPLAGDGEIWERLVALWEMKAEGRGWRWI